MVLVTHTSIMPTMASLNDIEDVMRECDCGEERAINLLRVFIHLVALEI